MNSLPSPNRAMIELLEFRLLLSADLLPADPPDPALAPTDANTPPQVNAGADAPVTMPNPVDLNGSATDDGLLGALTFTWSVVSGPGNVIFGDYTDAVTQATFDLDGSYVLELSAFDGEFTSVDDVAITVLAAVVNTAPQVDAGPDAETTMPNPVDLNGSATDDGLIDAITFSWTVVSGPGSVTFGDDTAAVTQASFDMDGSYVLELSAFDGELASVDDVTITVLPAVVNTAPQVDAGPDAETTMPNPVDLNGSATDDGLIDAITFSWTVVSGPGNVTFGDDTAAVTQATFDVDGTYVLELTAFDGEFASVDDVTITVVSAGVNAPPVVDAGDDTQVVLPNSFDLLGAVTDDDLLAPVMLTWSIVSGPGTATFGDATAAVTRVSFDLEGPYVLRLSAFDGELTTSDDVTVTVLPAGTNVAPLVSAGSDAQVVLPNSFTLQGSATDDRLVVPVVFAWSMVSGPGTATFADPAAASTQVTFDLEGDYVLQLSAFDGELTSTDTVTITVLSVGANMPPQATAGGDLQVALPNPVTLRGSATDDGLAAPVSFMWSLVNGPGIVNFTAPDAAVTQAYFSVEGIYVIQLAAFDGELTGTDTMTVNVLPVGTNLPPEVDAGPDPGVRLPGPVDLLGAVTDDGLPGPAVVTWSMVSGPGIVMYSDSHAATTRALFSLPGVYVLRLTADDGQYTAADDVTVTITSYNTAPQVSAGADLQVTVPGPAILNGTVQDDGLMTPLVITWSQVSGPGAATFTDPSVAATQATFDSSGLYVLRLLVDDGEFTVSDDVTVTVLAVNTPPQVEAGLDAQVTVQCPMDLQGVVTDDALPGPATVLWSVVSGPGTVIFSDPAAAVTQATFSVVGAYVLHLSANDGEYIAGDDVTVVVIPINAAPQADAGADAGVEFPGPVWLLGNATDDGIPGPLTVTWSVVSGPGAVTFADQAAAATTATFSAVGIYVLRLSASDTIDTVSDDLTVMVGSANQRPTANAGPDGQTMMPAPLSLNGTVQDDGLAMPIKATWLKVSGPGTVTFSDPSSPVTTASFSKPGTYVLRLRAFDGRYTVSDDMVAIAGATVASWSFNEGSGVAVNDTSGNGLPLNLAIADASKAAWVAGGLALNAPTKVASSAAAAKLLGVWGTLIDTDQFTWEAWVSSAGASQDGYIVGLTGPGDAGDFALEQQGGDIQAVVRTSAGGDVPSAVTASAAGTNLQHLVFTRAPGGTTMLYVNGQPATSANIGGDLSNWASSYYLVLGNSYEGTEPWLGTYYSMSVYNVALTASQVRQLYDAGLDATLISTPSIAAAAGPSRWLHGDGNGDGVVDDADLSLVFSNYGRYMTNCPGDVNGDGLVNVGDLGIVSARYGTKLAEATAPMQTMGLGAALPPVSPPSRHTTTIASAATAWVSAVSTPATAATLAATATQDPPAPEYRTVISDDMTGIFDIMTI